MEILKILYGLMFMAIGVIGVPSELNEPPNTATILLLTGVIIVIFSLNKKYV